jgi:hypothetical protein
LVKLHGGEYCQCYLASREGQARSKQTYVDNKKGMFRKFLKATGGVARGAASSIGGVASGVADKVQGGVGGVSRGVSRGVRKNFNFNKISRPGRRARRKHQLKLRKLHRLNRSGHNRGEHVVKAVSVLSPHQCNFLVSRLKTIEKVSPGSFHVPRSGSLLFPRCFLVVSLFPRCFLVVSSLFPRWTNIFCSM